jgi:bifunctional DNA-binding transcriptional regulator/antitoxin component of YhaV-PrlF toxin-antitoxin module
MSITVREEGFVPIPEDLAQEFGIHAGSHIEWERTDDGRLALRPAMSRSEAVRTLRGMGKQWLKPGESGVSSFLQWRDDERLADSTY